ncbi:MAG: hypothetical protein WCD53_29680, partial [Microcoleus sp.]
RQCRVPTFLDAIARFDGTICLITDSPHPTIPTFSPQDNPSSPGCNAGFEILEVCRVGYHRF